MDARRNNNVNGFGDLSTLPIRTFLVAAMLAGASFEQPQKLEFEVASIKSIQTDERIAEGCRGGPGS
jgi:hypothetical protein